MKSKSAIAFFIAAMHFSMAASAQEELFKDYEALKDSMNQRMIDFEKKYGCMNINNVRRLSFDKMEICGEIDVEADMPKPRTKRLDANGVWKKCHQSSLAFATMRENKGKKESFLTASAIAITADGICLTNYHVVVDVVLSAAVDYFPTDDCMRYVMDYDGNVFPLKEILAVDPTNDWAIIRVDTRNKPLVPIPLGRTAEPGDKVYCISAPKATPYVMTEGIVSRNSKVTSKQDGLTKWQMEITADYAVGSSGGPIIDQYGNLVGMVSSTFAMYGNQKKMQNFQMSQKKTVPVMLIKKCLKK
ncbi:MAG: serine protease [Prevotella sp.]